MRRKIAVILSGLALVFTGLVLAPVHATGEDDTTYDVVGTDLDSDSGHGEDDTLQRVASDGHFINACTDINIKGPDPWLCAGFTYTFDTDGAGFRIWNIHIWCDYGAFDHNPSTKGTMDLLNSNGSTILTTVNLKVYDCNYTRYFSPPLHPGGAQWVLMRYNFKAYLDNYPDQENQHVGMVQFYNQ